MTSITARRALWGAGLSILLSAAGGGAILFGAPHLKADAATDISAPPPAVPVSVARAESRRIATWEEFPAVWKQSTGLKFARASAALS